MAHHAYEKKIARTNPARGETVENHNPGLALIP